MTDFMIRFLISNVFIAAVTAVLALVRGLFSRVLSARMRYLLWFVLLGLLAVSSGCRSCSPGSAVQTLPFFPLPHPMRKLRRRFLRLQIGRMILCSR